MTHLKSVSAPAIGEAGLKRLIAFARPSRLTAASTLFDAGYEQCKIDLLAKINAEVAVPVIIEPPTQLAEPGSYHLQQKQARSRWPW